MHTPHVSPRPRVVSLRPRLDGYLLPVRTPTEGSLLERWRGNDVEKLATVEEHDMREDGFDGIFKEFDADFEGVKHLAGSLC